MKRVSVILSLLLAAADNAVAQAPPLRLTLDDAITRGIEANPRLEELGARQEAARAVEEQREAAGQPQLAAIASYTRTNHVDEFRVANALGGVQVIYPDIPDQVRSRIDLQWPIYTGGRLAALTRAAGAEAEAAGHDREAARADLKLEITRAFWAVLTARASVDVVRQALERTSAHLVDVRNQLGVGLVPPSDVLTIEAQHARQRMLSIEAEAIVETTTADFRRLVGVDQDMPLELIADLSAARGIPASFGETRRSLGEGG
jgi:outer membrane protein